VILGSGVGACLTLVCLVFLRLRMRPGRGSPISVFLPLVNTALPLGAADVLKAGINTTENLMVPRRLALHPETTQPLAAFGCVSGMVFPVMMFPACILFALAELLIPELARCAAAGSVQRIRYLTRRGLWLAAVYGCAFSGLMYLLADPLCIKLYGNADGAPMLRLYATLVPMLYCDAIVDAMTKGLGQQKICVQYNILTSALDVSLLFVLLPKFGMEGYFTSFLITHLINFTLSLRLLLKITKVPIPFYIPALSFAAAIAAVIGTSHIHGTVGQIFGYISLLGSILTLFQITGKEDIQWISGLLNVKK
jgi:stage V sporulation protein B